MNKIIILSSSLFIIFLGIHQASAITVPIIVPTHTSEPTEYSMICVKINATTSVCNPPPPSPGETQLKIIFLLCVGVILGILVFMIWWVR